MKSISEKSQKEKPQNQVLILGDVGGGCGYHDKKISLKTEYSILKRDNERVWKRFQLDP